MRNPYEKLEIALESGLPNEVDFVFNTILLLSSDESHQFRIYASRRLVDLMLGHVGFFGAGDKHNFRYLYDKVWASFDRDDHAETTHSPTLLRDFLDESADKEQQRRKKFKRSPSRNYVEFWHNAVHLPDDNTWCQRSAISALLPKLSSEFLHTLPELDVLNLREAYDNTSNIHGMPDACLVEFKRIEQVLVVLNNLSFEENNADYLANKCPALFEFLVMCLYVKSAHADIRRHALDTLANISRKMMLKLLSQAQKNLLVISLTHLIVGYDCDDHKLSNADDTAANMATTTNHLNSSLLDDQDQMDIIRGLEVITKLCAQALDPFDEENSNEKWIMRFSYQNEAAAIEGSFVEKVILRIEELLSVQDVLVLVHALECLYQLSQNSQLMCNLIAVKMVPSLVNFLTVDMCHFGLPNPPPTTVMTTPNSTANQSVITATVIPNPNILNGQVITALPRTVNSVANSSTNGPITTSTATTAQGGPIKMYKIVPSNGVATLIAANSVPPILVANQISPGSSQIHINTTSSSAITSNINKATSLLQQTLTHNQQQQSSNLNSPNNSGSPATITRVINANIQQQPTKKITQIVNRKLACLYSINKAWIFLVYKKINLCFFKAIISTASVVTATNLAAFSSAQQDQQAKNNLCNW